MTRPRILYLTDDRTTYTQGNYYFTYQKAFARLAELTTFDVGSKMAIPAPLDSFDLVVLGHSAVENFSGSSKSPKKANSKRKGGVRHVLRRALKRAGVRRPSWLKRVWARHSFLRDLRRARVKCIFLSKNDYKNLSLKRSFIQYVRPDLVITHSRSAVPELEVRGVRTSWLPFGIDPSEFRIAPGVKRSFQIGFRANNNSTYNDGERERLYQALVGLPQGTYETSLSLSRDGENFLLGQDYVSWLSSCELLANTVSAIGTVGPRFLESMACGCVPLAPENEYECLLLPDHHYVSIRRDFSNLSAQLERFFGDADYRARLDRNCEDLVAEHSVDRQVRALLTTQLEVINA